MRSFMVICLFATSVYADVSHLGYAYGQGGLTSGSLGLGGVRGGVRGGVYHGLSNLGSSLGSTYGRGGVPLASLSEGSVGVTHVSGSLGGIGSVIVGPSRRRVNHRVEESPATVEFTKEFYSFDAPQEEAREDESLQRVKESLKKSLQVVFVKTPENRNVEHAALSLAKTASEHNTAIYVLHREPDVSEFTNELNLIHSHNVHRPQVHLVKYKTPDEAATAQREIASRYESLGGLTVHRHGGIPEVLNYASQYAPSYSGRNVVSVGQGLGGIVIPSQKYLPVQK